MADSSMYVLITLNAEEKSPLKKTGMIIGMKKVLPARVKNQLRLKVPSVEDVDCRYMSLLHPVLTVVPESKVRRFTAFSRYFWAV